MQGTFSPILHMEHVLHWKTLLGKFAFPLLPILPSKFQEQNHILFSLIGSLGGFSVMSQKLMTDSTLLFIMSPENPLCQAKL